MRSALVHRSTPRPKGRVLIADDEQSIRTFTAKVLGDAGYEVVAAANGPEALKIAEDKGPFDLYVLDLMMPLMNGDEVARLLRRADPDVKVLYFTGHSDRLFERASTLFAHEAFLEKPVTVKGLLEAVSLLLFGHIRR
jgi:two-component system cell cycle sensor histidine kinase/response regulator CckA